MTFAAGQILTADELETEIEIQHGTVVYGGGGSTGTVTSGTTELKDSGVADITFTALDGVRYRVVLNGRGFTPSVATDRFALNVRDGGASSPDSSSTLWGQNQTYVGGSTNPFSCPFMATDTPGAGTVTLGVFWVRVAGTGTATPNGAYEFYVEALGTV